MLEMNYIDLVEKYCVVCKECDCVLFETDIIDGFLRYKTEGSQLNYFVLALQVKLSIKVSEQKILCKQQPFDKIYMHMMTCQQCKTQVGFQLKSANAKSKQFQIKGHFIIQADKIKVKELQEDITEQYFKQFYIPQFKVQYKQEQSNTSVKKKKRQVKTKSQEKEKEKEVERVNLSREEAAFKMKKMRDSLQIETVDKNIIKQVIQSYDFFLNILQCIERRVDENTKIMKMMKKQIEEGGFLSK